MDAIQYVNALRKRWPVLLALLVLGALGGYLFASLQPVLYRATSSVFVSSQRGATTSELVQASNFTQGLVQSYAELAKQPAVLDPVIEALNLNRSATSLATSVSTSITADTVIIQITVVDQSPERAAAIANAVTASLATVATGLAPASADEGPAITMTPVASAQVPSKPFAPNISLLVSTGALVGLVLAVVYAVARELLDTRLRSDEDTKSIKELADVPLIGTVVRRRGRRKPPLVMFAEPHSIAAEDYRRLVTNLEFAGIDRRIRSLAVTSSVAGEGKTTTSINLAAAIAERGNKVLLVDADMRRSAVAGYLDLEGAVGLTNVLLGSAVAEDAIQTVGTFDVLVSGTLPPNVTQLVTSASMSRLVAELVGRYDFVVFDCPPLLPVADALTFSSLTDGALIVARQRMTRRQNLINAVHAVEVVHGTIIGLVLNGVDGRRESTYGYAPTELVDAPSVHGHSADEPPQSFFRDASAAVKRPAPPMFVETSEIALVDDRSGRGERARSN